VESEAAVAYQIGDPVEHADEDLGLTGTVIGVSWNGWLTVRWDQSLTHADDLRPLRP
jgi:hypothetical protein